MQGYKRIVSYIYAYENNQKKNNVGFAKVEARDNIGRLTFQINGRSSLENDELLVYFLHIGTYHEGINIGECRARNGQVVAEFRISTEDIGSSGLDLSEMQGLYFRTREIPEKVFASSWINEDLNLQEFKEFDATAAEEIVVDVPEIRDVIESVEEVKETKENILEEVEDNGKEVEPEQQLQAAVINEAPEIDAEEEEIIKTFFDALVLAEEEKVEDNTEDSVEEVEVESICDNSEKHDSYPEECEQVEKKNPWEHLCCRYPKVIAFENNMGCMCLKVDIKDMEAIFGREFRMAPNTFAIRSYLRYRYLLLIENEKDSEGKSCILGVPGIFNHNDNMMANMCGFNEFRASKHVEKINGRFGYWLKEMKL